MMLRRENYPASGLLAICCLTLQAATGADSTRDNLIVTTGNGRFRGIRYYLPSLEKTVDAFLGIPFARPPVGSLRFRHPQPYVHNVHNNTVYDATRLPNSCYQVPDNTFGSEFAGSNMWNPTTKVSEDCLYLNVWVPRTRPRLRKSAVMIWIFGGGFYSGTPTLNLYDGKILAAENSVIVVSINYRIGAFGFFFLNSASAPANAGLFDQLMGLEWVQQNIRAFGGDPNNVTLFGESAGAASVSLHLLSPLSRSKFQRAILQSGSANMPWAALTMAEALRRSTELAVEVLGCPAPSPPGARDAADAVAECMREVRPQLLVDTQYVSKGVMQFPFLPVIDGAFLPDSPAELLRRRNFKKCPLLLGSNRNEGSYWLFYELDKLLTLESVTMTAGDFRRSIRTLFYYYPQYNQVISGTAMDAITFQYTNWVDPEDPEANVLALDGAVGDSQFICPLNRFAYEYASAGENVYAYFLTQRYSVNPWPRWTGVLHGDDVLFVFGEAFKAGLNFSDGDKALTRKVMTYWTNFAKTGDPNQIPGGMNLDEWPLHSPTERKYLELNSRFLGEKDKSRAVGKGLRVKECAFWDVYIPGLLGDKAFDTSEKTTEKGPPEEDKNCSSSHSPPRLLFLPCRWVDDSLHFPVSLLLFSSLSVRALLSLV